MQTESFPHWKMVVPVVLHDSEADETEAVPPLHDDDGDAGRKSWWRERER